MIIRLAGKFYIQHAKRSIRGSKIIAFSLIAVLISQILIIAFTSQILGLTSLVESDDSYLVITPSKSQEFEQNEFQRLFEFLEFNTRVESVLAEFRDLGEIYNPQNDQYQIVTLHFLDISQLISEDEYFDNFYPTKEFESHFNIGQDLLIKHDENEVTSIIQEFFDTNDPSIDTGIFLSNSLFNITSNSHIYVQVTNRVYQENLRNSIQESFDVNISTSTEEAQFLNDAKDNIISILNLLSIMILFLIFLGISNLIRTILFESIYDIRVLKSIGYGITEIRLIYILLTGLMGTIGSLLSITIGIALPNIIFASLSIVTDVVFISTEITLQIIVQTFLIGIFTPIISSMNPVRRLIS